MSVGQVHIYVRDRDFRTLGKGSYALKQVLERLSWFADEEGTSVFPKVQTLADALGVTPRAVQYNLRRLEELELIAVEEEARQHRPRIYRIAVKKILAYPLTETGRNRLERENQALDQTHNVPGVKTTSSGEKPQEPRGEKYVAQGCKVGQPGVKSTSSHIDEESLQESGEESDRRAREEAGGGRPDGPPPACAVWRDNQAALEALACWPLLERAIPDHDDGEVLTLAVETPLAGFGILTWAAPAAAAVLGRAIACRVRHWVQAALIDRGVMRIGTASTHRHRRDGDEIGLDDPAWRLWCAYAAEIEALPAAALLVNCLPDDLDQNGLHLGTANVATHRALLEEAGASLAKLLGVAIVPRTIYCLDLILAARRTEGRGEAVQQATGAGASG